MYNSTAIAAILKARLLQSGEPVVVEYLLTDSRRLIFPAATLFFALPGNGRNGNAFITNLYQKGVRCFVVDNNFAAADTLPGANIWQVDDVLKALQQLAVFHRQQFTIPVIGITGSNGKTIVKEWLYHLLQQDYGIARSPKSYNSQIGVPLSVWSMNSQHNLAIFEAGISQPGEMQHLQKIIRPTIGILTNIGPAHDEGFANRQQKLQEKVQLFTDSEMVIGKAELLKEAALPATTIQFSWGDSPANTLQIKKISKFAKRTVIDANYKQRLTQTIIPFTDDASIENAISCWCILLHLGIEPATIIERMAYLQPVAMRLELKQGINGCAIINDSYSADIHSLGIALDFLLQQQQHPKRTVVLSDLAGTGREPKALYEELAAILQQKNIDRLVGVGSLLSQHAALFTELPQTHFFTDTASLLQQLNNLYFSNETILVKGARSFAFEQLIAKLEQKKHQTLLEINLTAVAQNFKAYKSLLQPDTKMMVMVKASGYGSGSFEVANLLQFHQADYLAVAYTDEGVELRRAGCRLPIMVMNVEEGSFATMTEHKLEPELYSFGILKAFEQFLEQQRLSNYPVHIKLDTGMHRLGFEAADIPALCTTLAGNQSFRVQSVFSHLASSDGAAYDDFTRQQATVFLQGADALQNALGYSFLRHIANTAAIHRHRDLQLDMVRLGIGLYGADNHPTMLPLLKNVATLKTTIAQLKKVPAGQTVGYSRKGMVSKDSLIATVRIGYADGYPRLLSNGQGTMLVNGVAAPVIGNVCMDMTMLDVSDIPNVKEGDEVIVFGPGQPVNIVAAQANTIAYEILTGITQRVQRVYFEE